MSRARGDFSASAPNPSALIPRFDVCFRAVSVSITVKECKLKLFVGNLPYTATENDLQTFFEQAGVTVDSVNVMRDRFSGEARGFGFVEIRDDAQGNHAVEACNGRELMGRALVVNEARPMVPREGGGGGGGNRGGGRDFGGGGGGGNRRGGGGGGGGRNRY
jgi:RNA recognition motif-containing protein